MLENDIYQLLKEEFKVHTTINKDDNLNTLGLDSLELISLIVEIESKINRTISDEEMGNLITIYDLLLLVEQKLSEK